MKETNEIISKNLKMERKSLNELEQKALAIATELSEMAYTTDEITAEIAFRLKISKNAAKGYVGQLCEKGYMEKCETKVNGKKYYQFDIKS